MSKKVVKIIAIVIAVIIASLWLLFDSLIYPMITFWGDEGTRGMFVKSIIKNALHIPYQHYKPIGEPSEYKEGWQDLEPISDDEWFSMKCEQPETNSYYTTYLAEQFLSKEQQKQVHCVRPQYRRGKSKHCTSIFNCPSIRIFFYDYILEHPKVLDNVIKIMEKPCDYLSDDHNLVVRERNFLRCNYAKNRFYEKNRTYSVIYILDKDGKKKTEIIVPRKDNAHLVK